MVYVNLIRDYLSRTSGDEPGYPVAALCVTKVPQTVTDEEKLHEETDGESILAVDLPTSNRFSPNSHTLSNFEYYCSELENKPCKEIKSLLSKYPEITTDRPGLCTIMSHDISLTEECKSPIRLPPYKLNPAKTALLKQEVQYLLDYII